MKIRAKIKDTDKIVEVELLSSMYGLKGMEIFGQIGGDETYCENELDLLELI